MPWEPGTLRVEARAGGTVIATQEVKTAGSPAAVKLSVDRSAIAADGRDLAFVTADVVDAAGVLVPTATNSVQFSVTGPDRIAGTDNGNPIDVSAALVSPTRSAFGGKALAIVRSTGSAGAVQVTARSAGLTSGAVTVSAR